MFKQMGLETVEPGVEAVYRPSADDEEKCYEFGKQFGEKTIEYHKRFDGGKPCQTLGEAPNSKHQITNKHQ